MTNSQNAFLNAGFPQAQSLAKDLSNPESSPLLCTLRWRQDKLWVNRAEKNTEQIALPALASPKWFRSCLTRSRAEAVCVDPALGNEAIWMWTRACHEANKPLYLRLPKCPNLPKLDVPRAWALKRLGDYGVAGLLLALISPLMGLIAGLIWLEDRGPILSRQWRVGERGRLFQVYNFRTEPENSSEFPSAAGIKWQSAKGTTRVGGWLKRLRLNRLPQLFNVLRGEMSLVGPHPWSIYESVNLPNQLKARLNVLPGMTGSLSAFNWQRDGDIDYTQLAKQDLDRILSWSLQKDLVVLGQTVFQAVAYKQRRQMPTS